LQVGCRGRAVQEKGGLGVLILFSSMGTRVDISGFPCPSDNVKNSAIFCLCSGRHHDLNKFASGHFKNLEMPSLLLLLLFKP
jgi:hypothetical protein